MRIVFLDIDGPMIPDQVALLPKKDRVPLRDVTKFPFYSSFSPYSVSFIRVLCKSMDARIVTSSTHNANGLEHITELFRVNGLDPEEYLHPEQPMTKYHNYNGSMERDEGVALWMMDHMQDVSGIVIIDDSLFQDYDDHMADTWGINASSLYGLSPYQLKEAQKKIKNRKKNGWLDEDYDYFMKVALDQH